MPTSVRGNCKKTCGTFRLKSDCPVNQISVIPAQAGIQQYKLSAQRIKNRSCPATQAFCYSLDSRLRGNDSVKKFHSIPRTRGFTLLELLVVMVIAGIILGMVSFKAMPDDKQVLQQDAQRIALLLQLARDEAIVRNRPIAFEADANHYHFLIREEQLWQPLVQDELLRERDFKHTPMIFTLTPAAPTTPLRIMFGREPVDKPFVLSLAVGNAQVNIRADGIGHFSVE
ncbi:MAG: GspH/FimT family pseudopilin [Gallionella sp.]